MWLAISGSTSFIVLLVHRRASNAPAGWASLSQPKAWAPPAPSRCGRVILIGWLRHVLALGAKIEECGECHTIGPHLFVRLSYWFTLFRVPLLLLWLRHELICVACYNREKVGFARALRAMRTSRLPLDRDRPLFAAATSRNNGVAPADWAAFGLDENAAAETIDARFRSLAKQMHPDAGGSARAFVQLQTTRERLKSAKEGIVRALPSASELFDPLVVVPKRGLFDFYTKAWPVLFAALAILGSLQPSRPADPSGIGNSSRADTTLLATAHECWGDGEWVNGCVASNGTTLFGTRTGSPYTCYFAEPVTPQMTMSCKPR
jgi:hypothetical protein